MARVSCEHTRLGNGFEAADARLGLIEKVLRIVLLKIGDISIDLIQYRSELFFVENFAELIFFCEGIRRREEAQESSYYDE